MTIPTSTRRRRLRPRACRTTGHVFGPWWACACGQSVPSHAEPGGAVGSCAFEIRVCTRCYRELDERHVTDTTRLGVPQPGGPSAKTIRRAGSPHHRQGSEETPSLEPPRSPSRGPVVGRAVTFAWGDEHAFAGVVVAPTERDKPAPDAGMLLVQWQARPGLRVWEYHDDLRPLGAAGGWPA